jgi:hypothetical protein
VLEHQTPHMSRRVRCCQQSRGRFEPEHLGSLPLSALHLLNEEATDGRECVGLCGKQLVAGCGASPGARSPRPATLDARLHAAWPVHSAGPQRRAPERVRELPMVALEWPPSVPDP